MKAITIREPYASLVMLGEKRIETRSWAAPSWLIGQRIAIHAAKGLTLPELEMIAEQDFLDAFAGHGSLIFDPIVPDKPVRVADAFPHTRGKVIATAILSQVFRFTPVSLRTVATCEFPFGDFSLGRYGWYFSGVKRLPEPIPARGELGVWEWTHPEGLVAA